MVHVERRSCFVSHSLEDYLHAAFADNLNNHLHDGTHPYTLQQLPIYPSNPYLQGEWIPYRASKNENCGMVLYNRESEYFIKLLSPVASPRKTEKFLRARDILQQLYPDVTIPVDDVLLPDEPVPFYGVLVPNLGVDCGTLLTWMYQQGSYSHDVACALFAQCSYTCLANFDRIGLITQDGNPFNFTVRLEASHQLHVAKIDVDSDSITRRRDRAIAHAMITKLTTQWANVIKEPFPAYTVEDLCMSYAHSTSSALI